MISCLAEMTGAAGVEIMFFLAHFQLLIVSVRIVKNMRTNFEEDINILLNSICFIPDLIHPSQELSSRVVAHPANCCHAYVLCFVV